MIEKKTSLGKGLSALFGENKVDLRRALMSPWADLSWLVRVIS